MDTNTPDYLTYKKSKQKLDAAEKKPARLRIVFWLCVLTFALCFGTFTNFAVRYGTKMDIEYDKSVILGDGQNYIANAFGEDSLISFEQEREVRAIDNRLRLIQLEEMAPSGARALNRDTNVVMEREHYERITSGEDIFAPERPAVQRTKPDEPQKDAVVNVSASAAPSRPQAAQQNVAAPTPRVEPSQISSKVLVGRYRTFEDAKAAQTSMREATNQGASPFIRRVGEVYTLQIGSFSNPDIAKNVAQSYSDLGHNVWVIQN
jgi:hypothetical protein